MYVFSLDKIIRSYNTFWFRFYERIVRVQSLQYLKGNASYKESYVILLNTACYVWAVTRSVWKGDVLVFRLSLLSFVVLFDEFLSRLDCRLCVAASCLFCSKRKKEGSSYVCALYCPDCPLPSVNFSVKCKITTVRGDRLYLSGQQDFPRSRVFL